MYELKVNQTKTKVNLFFRESLTINNAAEVKTAFINAIEQSDNLIIDHYDTQEYDLSYLQLLIALSKTAISSGKKITIRCNDSESFIRLLEDSGSYALAGLEIQSNNAANGGEGNV